MSINATAIINTTALYNVTQKVSSPTSSVVITSLVICANIIPSYGSIKLNSFMENKTASNSNQSVSNLNIAFSNSATNESIYKSLSYSELTHEINRQGSEKLDQFSEYNEKLMQLAQLSKNWDSYGAEPPNKIALNWAKETLIILSELELFPIQIGPSVENGVGISFMFGKKYADIECFNEGDILAVTSDRQGNPDVWEVEASTLGIKSAIEKIRVFLQS